MIIYLIIKILTTVIVEDIFENWGHTNKLLEERLITSKKGGKRKSGVSSKKFPKKLCSKDKSIKLVRLPKYPIVERQLWLKLKSSNLTSEVVILSLKDIILLWLKGL